MAIQDYVIKAVTDGDRVAGWFSALCVLPWLVVVSPYVEACLARLALSRWPRPMLDDPKNLATAPLHWLSLVLFLSLAVAIPLVAVWAVRNGCKLVSDWRYRVRIGVFATGLLAVWTLTHYDPARIWDWFFN